MPKTAVLTQNLARTLFLCNAFLCTNIYNQSTPDHKEENMQRSGLEIKQPILRIAVLNDLRSNGGKEGRRDMIVTIEW